MSEVDLVLKYHVKYRNQIPSEVANITREAWQHNSSTATWLNIAYWLVSLMYV